MSVLVGTFSGPSSCSSLQESAHLPRGLSIAFPREHLPVGPVTLPFCHCHFFTALFNSCLSLRRATLWNGPVIPGSRQPTEQGP